MLGQAVLLNYYTIFDSETASLAFVEAYYTITTHGMTAGAISFICLLAVITGGGIIGCVKVYRSNKR